MFERCMYFNTNALARKLNERWNKAFAEFDLPPSHGYLLRLVLNHPGLTQQEIANEMQLDKSTVTRFISKLEDKKLIQRKSSDDDQRQNAIHPTKKSQAIHDDLEMLGDELYQSMCDALGKKNVDQFVNTLRTVSDKL